MSQLGALDSDTSVQIMNILKEISKTKLVIMVTHNPDLAASYATRIINLKDGNIISDTLNNALDENKDNANIEASKNIKDTYKDNNTNTNTKTSMSFFTALNLSFNNLMTKKARTILVALAGSIGIIGIALIMSLSNGFQNYIDKLQEDTMSSYPFTITSKTADMTSMLLSMSSLNNDNNSDNSSDNSNNSNSSSSEKSENNNENVGNKNNNASNNATSQNNELKVKEKQIMSTMFSSVSNNNLMRFKAYLENNYEQISPNIKSIKYTYSVSPYIYTIDAASNLALLNPSSLFNSIYSSSISTLYSSYAGIYTELIDDTSSLNTSYDILSGRFPTNYDELVIILPNKEAISDLLVYSLGLRDTKELTDIVSKVIAGETVKNIPDALDFTYEDLMKVDLRVIPQYMLYKYNEQYMVYENMSENTEYMQSLYENNSIKLKIVGIVAVKEGTSVLGQTTGVGYTSALTKYLIEEAKTSDIVQKQLATSNINVISNKRFDEDSNKLDVDFKDFVSVDNDMITSAFGSNINEGMITSNVQSYITNISSLISLDSATAKEELINAFNTCLKNILLDYIVSNKYEDGKAKISMQDIQGIVENGIQEKTNVSNINKLEANYILPSSVYTSTFKQLYNIILNKYISEYYKLDPSLTENIQNMVAIISNDNVNTILSSVQNNAIIASTFDSLAINMQEAKVKTQVAVKIGDLTGYLTNTFSNAFSVDTSKIAGAFKLNLSQDELQRVITSMMSSNDTQNAESNLLTLGYQDTENPTSISFYFDSFNDKEEFLEFIDSYNEKVKKENNNDEDVIKYVDTTGLLMGSVKDVINAVSYILIAFVSISLIVSSIMIGIITYISVLERTKEIGILRAIGASKKDVARVFNAETLIEGLVSGVLGIAITLLLCIPINLIVYSLTKISNVAHLPLAGGIFLIILSMILTLIAGALPAKVASKKDPVESLRSE